MGTLLRGSEVSGMYLGSNEISEMYLGSNLFYSSEYIMGVEWDKQADPAMTRIGDSKNFVANIGIGSEVVQNDFDRAPIYREMKRVTDDLGNVFVKIPKFYIRKTNDENLLRLEISPKKIEGSYLPYVFWDFENNKELDYFYYGAYLARLSDGKLGSKSGVSPRVSTTIVNFRNYAKNNGSGYQQLDIHAIDVIQTLFYVEFATLNSQSIHPGYTAEPATAFTGGTDSVVASSGSMGTSSSYQFMYRGIEDLWGNLFQFVDGVNITVRQAWVCEDADSYASNVFAAPYQELSYANNRTSGNVKEMGFDPIRPYARFPIAGGAESTSYYSSGYIQSAGGSVARFGGARNSMGSAGVSYWYMNGTTATSALTSGARLLRKPL